MFEDGHRTYGATSRRLAGISVVGYSFAAQWIDRIVAFNLFDRA
jgi:hypothetical protein